MFLDALREFGNVAAAARAAGFSESTIWQRRRKWAGFAERIEEALEEADLQIEFRLVAATNGLLDSGCGFAPVEGAHPPPTPQSPPLKGRGGATSRRGGSASGRGEFDPDLALRYLKWREAKRQGRAGSKGNARSRLPAIEDVTEKIVRQVRAIEKHSEAKRIEEGWTRAEDGYMIPPGWVRQPQPE